MSNGMPRKKIDDAERRELVLALLEKRAGGTELARRYGLGRTQVYNLLNDAKDDPERKLSEALANVEAAKAEVEFRQRVLELLDSK